MTLDEAIKRFQKYLTNPPIPFGGYQPKTMNDDEIKEQMNKGTDRCMKILFGEYTEHKDCRENCIQSSGGKESEG